jgi:aminoglycoside phosphotransferase (APT) family kinase protein
MLRSGRFQTIVHGDAKPDNFCFSDEGDRVASVDFQYPGGGPGIKDVAYLLYGTNARDEPALLDRYFVSLRAQLDEPFRSEADAIEREWRTLYPIAAEDFRRFLAGWHR